MIVKVPLLKFVFTVPIAIALIGCATPMDIERARMLDLSFQEFDQTEGSGFRLLLAQKKHVQAAELIEDYFERHRRNLTERERVSLQFHAGQLYGIVADAKRRRRI